MCCGSVGKKKRRGRRKREDRYESSGMDTFPEDDYMGAREADETFEVAGFSAPDPPPDNVIAAGRNLPSRPAAHDQISYSEAPSSRPPLGPGPYGSPAGHCSKCGKPECCCCKKCGKPDCQDESCCANNPENCADEENCRNEEECDQKQPPPDHAYASGYADNQSRNAPSNAYRPDPAEMSVGKPVIPAKITVQIHQNGQNGSINVVTNTTDTVFELRFHIFEATRILPSNQILMFKGRDLPLEKQLGECGVCDRSVLELTDHGEAITEYIIEITDAMKVRELKQDLRKLEVELREAKKRSADKLRQNDWEGTDRAVQEAQVLERRKQRRQKELEEIHEKHKQGFRQLHVKIMRLFSEKRKSSAEYARLKRELLSAVQRNEVLRSTEIVNDLMVQFIRHDGCERELMLLDAFVPDMVEASAEQRNEDDLSDIDEEPVVDPRKAPPRTSGNSAGYRGNEGYKAPPQQKPPGGGYRQQAGPYPRGFQPEQYPAQAPPQKQYYGGGQQPQNYGYAPNYY